MIRALAKKSQTLLISIDWTEWHPPLRMLVASVVTGTRAVPVYVATFMKAAIVRSQNCWENTFLKMLVMVLEGGGGLFPGWPGLPASQLR